MLDRFTIAAILTLTLTACGGGGSGSQINMMPPMTPTEPPPPKTLSLGDGLTIGSQSPIRATTAADTRVTRHADSSNKFRAYSASLIRDRNANTARISDRHSIQAIRSDGDYGLHVTYNHKDRELTREVHFPKTLLDNGSFAHEELGYWLWAHSSVPFNGMNYSNPRNTYLQFVGSTGYTGVSNTNHRLMAMYGLETPVDALPTGMATYSGLGYAEMFDDSLGDVGTNTGRTRLNYNVTLNMDFADNSLTGRIDMTQIRRPGSNDREAFTGTGFDITGGVIVDGQFTASLTGTDANSDAPLADSMRGFEGDTVGAFYGPEAENAGAVFTAERDMEGVHRVMMGLIYSSQDNNSN